MKLFSVLLVSLFIGACATAPPKSPPPPPPQQIIQPTVSEKLSRLNQPLAREEELVFSISEAEINASAISDPSARQEFSSTCLIETNEIGQFMTADEIAAHLKESLSRKWVKPRNIRKKYQCSVELHLAVSGCVTDVSVSGCKDNVQLVRSIEMALFRSAPLPEMNGIVPGNSLSFEFFAGP